MKHLAPVRQDIAIKLIPFIVGCALFMQMLDATVVATALPMMAVSLQSTPVRMNVAITSYLLAVAVFVPICGWAADRFGAKRLFLFAISLFALTSLTCALSWDLASLTVSRFIQGIAGAMMVPVGRIIMLRTIPRNQILKATSFLSIPALLGPILGPPLGGFLVTYAYWHWIFLINLQIAIIGIVLVLKYVLEYRSEKKPRLDWIGFLLSGVGMATFVIGIEAIGNHTHGYVYPLLLLGTGLTCTLLYIRHSRRHPEPIIDLSLLKIPTFSAAVLGGNMTRLSVGAMPFLLTLLFQVGFGYSALASGMITFSVAIGSLMMKFIATAVFGRWGFRMVLLINGTLTGLMTITNAFFTESTPVLLMGTLLLIGGFFRSLQFTGVNSLAFADIEPEQMSQASSFSATAQQIGISLGMGIATVTLDLSMQLRGASHVSIADIHTGFWVIGLLSIVAAYWFYKLDPKAGEGITVHKEKKNRVRFKRRRKSVAVSDPQSAAKPAVARNLKQ